MERKLGVRFPQYVAQEQQYTPNNTAGSTAKIQFPLNNWPGQIFRLSIVHTLVIPDAYIVTNPSAPRELQWLASDVMVRVNAAQQNWTTDWIHLWSLQGYPETPWQPLPASYNIAGGNYVQVELQRNVGLPLINDVQIGVTIKATMVLVVTQSDMMPGTARGSTGRP